MPQKTIRDHWPYIFIAFFAFFIFHGIFRPGFMSGYDNSFHYYDAYYLTTTLLPKHHWISGWSMQAMAGLPIFVDYYQAPFILIAVLNKLFLMPLGLAYKIMVLASYMALGTGFFRIALERFGRLPSLTVALSLMLQKDIYLDRILNGVWNNYLAIGIFLVFFHLVDRYIEGLSFKRMALLSLLLGLVILTHIYVAMAAFILLLIYLAPYARSLMAGKGFLKGLAIYISIPLLAVMMTSYYLYGFVAARDWFSHYPAKDMITGISWSLKSFFGPLESVKSISGLVLNAPVILRIAFSIFGLYIFFLKEDDPAIKRFLWCTALLVGVSLLAFSDLLSNAFAMPLLGMLQTNRLLVYAHLGMYLFAAYGIAQYLKRLKQRKVVVFLLLAVIAASSVFHYIYFARPESRMLEDSPNMSDIRRVWGWVDKNARPTDARVVYQNTIGNVDDPILARSDVFALSGVFTKVPQIGVSRSATPFPQEKHMRNDHGRIFGRPLAKASVSYIEEMMNYFNAKYIVTVEPGLEGKLKSSKGFSEAARFGRFTIYRLTAFKGGWLGFSKAGSFRTIALDDEYVRFDIANLSDDNEAYVKIAYHPFWKAYLDDKPINLGQDGYGLMKMRLSHTGEHSLTLRFSSFSRFWTAVSLLGLVIAVGIVIRYPRDIETRALP